MRGLLTGHQGYLGTVMAPVLTAAGHEVVGLDAGLFADCVLGPAPGETGGAIREEVLIEEQEQIHRASVLRRLAVWETSSAYTGPTGGRWR